MKTIAKFTFFLLLVGQAKAFAATCEATNSWLVVTHPLKIGKTRVPGNTMIDVYDNNDQLIVGFSADSEAVGTEPDPGEQDTYQIAATFQDKIGLTGFSWSTPYGCPRCSTDWDHLPSYITIESDSGTINLICKQ